MPRHPYRPPFQKQSSWPFLIYLMLKFASRVSCRKPIELDESWNFHSDRIMLTRPGERLFAAWISVSSRMPASKERGLWLTTRAETWGDVVMSGEKPAAKHHAPLHPINLWWSPAATSQPPISNERLRCEGITTAPTRPVEVVYLQL